MVILSTPFQLFINGVTLTVPKHCLSFSIGTLGTHKNLLPGAFFIWNSNQFTFGPEAPGVPDIPVGPRKPYAIN